MDWMNRANDSIGGGMTGSSPLRICIVEDDARVAQYLRKGLVESGLEASVARTGGEALDLISREAYDLVLLDLGLPDRDGREVLAGIRQMTPQLPVLVVTARDEVADRVAGLEAGADDYLVKPFAFAELLARIHALHRRSARPATPMVVVGDLVLDIERRHASRGGQGLELTPREFDLLLYLARNAGRTLSREMLARDVWKIQNRMTALDNVLDVHMNHLREKVDKPFESKLLRTVRGVGFRLDAAT